jgi:DNA polymerase-1
MSRRIESWEQLQGEVEPILDRLNADPELAIAAAVNPLYALEELGYELDPQASPQIEDRLRFDPRTVIRLQRLRATIFEYAGREFDLRSSDELRQLLFEELSLPVPEPPPDTSPLPPQIGGQPRSEPVLDPLEVLSDAHPIMESLLEYRRLEASRPRLAPRHLYEEVRQGKRRLPIRDIRARLQSQSGRK